MIAERIISDVAATPGEFVTPPGYAHLSLALVDAVYSIRSRYPAVERVVAAYCAASGTACQPLAARNSPGFGEHGLDFFLDQVGTDHGEILADRLFGGSRSRTAGRLKADVLRRAARIMWRQTLELAVEADDATMTATVLRFRAYMAWLAAQPGSLIGLAQAAQRDRRAAVSQRAFSASLEARGHAMTGDEQAAERKLGEAAELGTQLGQRLAEPWSYWYSPGWLECQSRIALGYLAHIERYRTQAIEALASPEMVASATELTAGYLVHRASIHVRGGDAGEACADALRAVPAARQTSSVSLYTLLTDLHATMAARWPGDPRVAELADALR